MYIYSGILSGCFLFVVFVSRGFCFIRGFYMHASRSRSRSRSRSGVAPVFAKIEWLQGSLLYLSREESLGNHFFEESPKKQI